MKRTRFPNQTPTYDSNDEPIVLSKPLLDVLLKQEHYPELIALYCFYYYTAKWQKTNQPHATTAYVSQGIGWHENKVKKIKKILKELGLISNVVGRDKEKKITGHYIKVNFIWSKTHPDLQHDQPTGRISHRVGILAPNSLNTNNKSTVDINLQFSSDIKQDKLSIPERNKIYYLPIARDLYSIIKSTKNIKRSLRQLKNWANDIRQITENDGIEIERIQNVIKWYRKNVGGEYIPIIESGRSLRDKFIRLEDAIKRSNNSIKQHSNKPKYIDDPDGGRYLLNETNGKYYHCRTKDLYIP